MIRNRSPSARGFSGNDHARSRGRPDRFRAGTTLKLWVAAENKTLNGGDVSQLNDQSGTGNHLAQATGANQPLWVASGQNGLPLVRFTGANSDVLFAATDATGTGDYTAFWAGSIVDSAAVKAIFTNEATGGWSLRKDGSNNRSVTHPNVAAGSDATMPTSVEFWVTTWTTGSAPNLFVKSAAQSLSGAPTTIVAPGATSHISINGEWNGGAYSLWTDQDCYEAGIYNRVINTSERNRLENYLHARLGV